MAITVARISYLGCEPFYYDMERRGIQLRDVAPNVTASALRNGEVDSAPIPLIDCLGLGDGFRPVGGFCITAANNSGVSVLHSREPITGLNGSRVVLPEEATTSRSLLKILLTAKHGVEPGVFLHSENGENSHDAFLLVGNQALRRRRGVRGFPHRYDLAEEWREWTGLPFVFCRWMVRADLDRSDAAILEDSMFVGQEDWLDNLYRMSGPRDDLVMLPKDVLGHIQSLRFYMGVTEQKSIDLFQEHLNSLELDRT